MTAPSFSEEKLTAYALGELSPAERREVEAELAAHPELRAELEAIQNLAAQLREELSLEASESPLGETQPENGDLHPIGGSVQPESGKIIPFRRNPWLYATGLLAAAACAALLLLPSLSTPLHRSASTEGLAKEKSVAMLQEAIVEGEPMPAETEEMPAQMDAMASLADKADSLEKAQAKLAQDASGLANTQSSLTPSSPAPSASPVADSSTLAAGGQSGSGSSPQPAVPASRSLALATATKSNTSGKIALSGSNSFSGTTALASTAERAGGSGYSYALSSPSADGKDLPMRGSLFSSSGKFRGGSPQDLQSNEMSLAELKSDYKAKLERLEKIKAMPPSDLDKTLPVGGVKSSENRQESIEGIRKGFEIDLETAKARVEAKEREVARMKDYFRRMRTAPSAGESYLPVTDNAFLRVSDQPLSTFSIDVDTASYTNLRRFLGQNQLPPPDAVRIEELVNYFSYNYPQPANDDPFSVTTEVAKAPWKDDHLLVRIGLQGRTVAAKDRPPANLVFLIDVSGSMSDSNKLPLVIASMKLLVEKLKPEDRVAITVYAGGSGLVLPSTPVSQRGEILEALSDLRAGGSTNGAMGIQLAYDIAKANFIKDGINRVILCTDGDFNVGVTNRGDLIKLIEEKAKSKVFLSVFGFGMGNLQDATLEQLANKGNGNYGYIDNPKEAKRVFVDQIGGTLQTIAKDVKIQVEFNPAVVGSYRLIGYENRLLAARDFNDDKKDAGEIGAGHRVTALYELVPVGVKDEQPSIDPLKYQKPAPVEYAGDKSEIMNVKLRYKQPDGDVSKLIENPVKNESIRSFEQEKSSWWRSSPAEVSGDFQFAAGVAAFGMILRDSPYKGDANLDLVLRLAGKGTIKQEDRTEFIGLVKKTKTLLNEDVKPGSK